MSAVITSFFQKHLATHADDVDEHIKKRRARLSAASLLVEVVNADGEFTADERVTLLASVQSQFSLTDSEAKDLLTLAQQQAHQATDLHDFTIELNRHFTPEQKLALIQELWNAAYSDEILHRHEDHLIRKVADLLHVPNTSALLAKQRAQVPDNKSK